MNLICMLGRQPELSLAELERQFGADAVRPFSDESALVTSESQFDVQRFGGITKAGQVLLELPALSWSRLENEITKRLPDIFSGANGKVTIGISTYGLTATSRDVTKLGLEMKKALKKRGLSVRLVPNDGPALSTASTHHNKLGLADNKVELLIVATKRNIIVARSIGSQNITKLAARDQGRPKRDAFVGMLPPKLALMMVNMAGLKPAGRILDPFCGTGVVLQEAALLGFDVYGSDLSEKMVDYSRINLNWLSERYSVKTDMTVELGDAIEHTWEGSTSAVVAETYLGQPFSAPPAPDKLQKVVRITNEILTKFLMNLAPQLKKNTPLVLAVPAWRDNNGDFTHLPLLHDIESLGYSWQELKYVDTKHFAYYREDQIVARQLLLLKKS
jgi:tRNA G10  N-methylase Trm11